MNEYVDVSHRPENETLRKTGHLVDFFLDRNCTKTRRDIEMRSAALERADLQVLEAVHLITFRCSVRSVGRKTSSLPIRVERKFMQTILITDENDIFRIGLDYP